MQVVVPVVARKKGMGEFYTRADGGQQRRPRSLIPEPVSHDPVLGYYKVNIDCTLVERGLFMPPILHELGARYIWLRLLESPLAAW